MSPVGGRLRFQGPVPARWRECRSGLSTQACRNFHVDLEARRLRADSPLPGPRGEHTKASFAAAPRWRIVSPPVFTDQDRPEIPPGSVWRQERLGTVAVYEVLSAVDDLVEVKVRQAPGLQAGHVLTLTRAAVQAMELVESPREG